MWAVKPKANRDAKFLSLAWEGILLGYENNYSAYQVYCPDDKTIFPTKHTYFDEADFPACPAAGRTTIAYGVNKLPAFNEADALPYAEDDCPLPTEPSTHQDNDEEEEIRQIKDHLATLRRRVARQAEHSPIPDPATVVGTDARPMVQAKQTLSQISSAIDPANI